MANKYNGVVCLEEYLKTRTINYNGCIVFTNKPNACGYGVLAPHSCIAKIYGQKLLHRVVWVHYNGSIPDNMCIMHTCDNRLCINIDHLKIGTWADNNVDRKLKGRNAYQKGNLAANVKLTEKQVLLIRDLKNEFSSTFLGEFFNVHYSTICYIWNRKLWSHL